MKGLLIKDLQIMQMQKKFLLLILGISFFMGLTAEDTSFLIGYIIFMCSILVLGTISYDDFDNGYTFLFTLPVSRKGYVAEKYLLAIATDIISWLLSIGLGILISTIKGETLDIVMTITASAMVMLVCAMLLFIMLPLQMKFGAEKSRIVMVSLVGICFIAAYLLKMLSEKMTFLSFDIQAFTHTLSSVSESTVLFIILALDILIGGITFFVSLRIMQNKQF